MPNQQTSSPGPSRRSSASSSDAEATGRFHLGRWIAIAIAVLFFGFVMKEVLFPFAGKSYLEMSHGDHVHYVPEERDEDVPLDRFPTRPPDPDERINASGKIVPKQ